MQIFVPDLPVYGANNDFISAGSKDFVRRKYKQMPDD